MKHMRTSATSVHSAMIRKLYDMALVNISWVFETMRTLVSQSSSPSFPWREMTCPLRICEASSAERIFHRSLGSAVLRRPKNSVRSHSIRSAR